LASNVRNFTVASIERNLEHSFFMVAGLTINETAFSKDMRISLNGTFIGNPIGPKVFRGWSGHDQTEWLPPLVSQTQCPSHAVVIYVMGASFTMLSSLKIRENAV
jgi:hypothetical protein